MGVPLMSGPPGPLALEEASDTEYRDFVRYAKAFGSFGRGHHNLNYMVRPLTEHDSRLVACEDGAPVTVRERIPSALPVVIRTWQDEAEILNTICGVLPHVPRCLVKHRDLTILSYVEGMPLSRICPNDNPLHAGLVRALADLLADMTQVRRRHLPPLPPSWPRSSRDSRAFLRTLAFAAEKQIRQRNWDEFGGLFAMLGIPEDAMVRFAEKVPATGQPPLQPAPHRPAPGQRDRVLRRRPAPDLRRLGIGELRRPVARPRHAPGAHAVPRLPVARGDRGMAGGDGPPAVPRPCTGSTATSGTTSPSSVPSPSTRM